MWVLLRTRLHAKYHNEVFGVDGDALQNEHPSE